MEFAINSSVEIDKEGSSFVDVCCESLGDDMVEPIVGSVLIKIIFVYIILNIFIRNKIKYFSNNYTSCIFLF